VGQVNFCDAAAAHCTDVHLLATAQITHAGTATFKFIPGVGSHSYKAVFLGTTTNASSVSSNAALSVTGKQPTATVIAGTGALGDYFLTATVGGNGSTPPTGSVSFIDTSDEAAAPAMETLSGGAAGLSFLNSSNPATGIDPNSVAVADFNGDGIPDLAVLGVNSGTITVFLGNGDGTFSAGLVQESGPNSDPTCFAVGDFNGDGIPDLAVGVYQSINVFLGKGDGTFGPSVWVSPRYFNFNAVTTAPVVGDFNGDGIADLAIISDGTLDVLLGKGDGTFELAFFQNAPPYAEDGVAMAAGDFTGNGILDLAVVTEQTNTVTVLSGNGDGTFKATGTSIATGVEPSSIAVGDFNGDGNLDLAVSNLGGNLCCEGTVTVLLGDGAGGFTATLESPETGLSSTPYGIAIGDFNGDGIPDLAIANYYSENDTVLLGNGDGTFKAAQNVAAGSASIAIAAADFNGDGVSDLVSIQPDANLATVFLAENQTASATATVTGILLTGNAGTQEVVAGYSGNSGYFSSASAPISLFATEKVTLSSTDLSFGKEQVGDSTTVQNVTLTNISGTALTVRSIYVAGADAASFRTSSTCGGSVAAGASCRIGVVFAPGASGPLSAFITLNSSLSGTPQNMIALTGTGIEATSGSLSLSATGLTLANEPVGYSSAAQSVTLTNTSSATLYFGSIALGGTNSGSFVTSNTCGASLAAGATCKIGVRIVPQATGPLSAAITLTDTAATSPQSISLSGTGITAPAASLTLSSTSLSFGAEAVGFSTAVEEVTVTNTSSVTLYFRIAETGADASSFVTSNTCLPSLAAGAICTISVRMIPQATGPLSAAITLTDTAATSPQSISLGGTGIKAPTASGSLDLSSTSVVFGTETVGVSTNAEEVFVYNPSSVTLYFGIAETGADASSFVISNTCLPSLAAGATCHIGVRFVPQATGPLSATIVLTDNSATSPQIISLSGTGTP
jgi:hypothetical protein